MRSLVLWCRWNSTRLHLHGRAENRVWGEIVSEIGSRAFRFFFEEKLLLIKEEGGERRLYLDDMGIVVRSEADE